MPRTSDRSLLRAVLHRDRAWCLYPLGDLDDRQFGFCEWYVAGASFLLVYRGAGTPVLITGGDAAVCAELLDEAGRPAPAHLHVPPDLIPHLETRYRRTGTRPLVRMALEAPRLPEGGAAQPLTRAHTGALERLYADGVCSGESPDFFFPAMLDDGTFFGVWENGELIAAAGTHLVAPGESVAAIGNVYTRRDCRGRGLGAVVTSAVVCCLLARGIATIALSVVERNTAALRLYERLGFAAHCRFVDGRVEDPVLS